LLKSKKKITDEVLKEQLKSLRNEHAPALFSLINGMLSPSPSAAAAARGKPQPQAVNEGLEGLAEWVHQSACAVAAELNKNKVMWKKMFLNYEEAMHLNCLCSVH
jgi:hypothetical protein